MDKMSIVKKIDELTGIESEHVFIEYEDGSFQSMFKSTWDELEAAKEKQSETL